MRTGASIAVLLAVVSPIASADIFVVDDDGGPGVDFTDLPPAVAAVQDGDTLLVREGTYTSFSTSKGITILGRGVASVPTATASGLPAGLVFAMRGMSPGHVLLDQCAGTVLIDHASGVHGITVASCSDVRLRDLQVYPVTEAPALNVVTASNVEVVECRLLGLDGYGGGFNDGGDGSDAVWIAAGSRVQIALSDVGGGSGGDCDSEWTSCSGGDGGHGIVLEESSELIVSGRGVDFIYGGSYGCNWFWDDFCGWEGIGIVNDGATRFSGADVDAVCCGYEETPAIADPFLLVSLQPGTLRVELHGVPGGSARLMVGSTPRVPSADFLVKPALIANPRIFSLGTIDASGVASMDIPWSAMTPFGERSVLYLQGSVFAANATVRTNSAFVLAR